MRLRRRRLREASSIIGTTAEAVKLRAGGNHLVWWSVRLRFVRRAVWLLYFGDCGWKASYL